MVVIFTDRVEAFLLPKSLFVLTSVVVALSVSLVLLHSFRVRTGTGIGSYSSSSFCVLLRTYIGGFDEFRGDYCSSFPPRVITVSVWLSSFPARVK